MTPDHKVLTRDGWIENQRTHSQRAIEFYEAQRKNGYDWANVWPTDGDRSLWERWQASLVELPMRLRQRCQKTWKGPEKFKESIFSVLQPEMPIFCGMEDSPWNEPPSSPCRVAYDDPTLHKPESARVQELRRTWDYGVRALVYIRKFLGGYAARIRSRVDARPSKQFDGILQGQLPMGHLYSTVQQSSVECENRHSMGSHEHMRGRRSSRNTENHLQLSLSEGSSRRTVIHENRNEEVFDIINCGPRNQFVVEGRDGQQFIVHNCIQAIARDVFYEKLVAIEEAGIPTLFAVHDEVITDEVHPSQVSEAEEYVGEIMRADCEWMPGVALDSEYFSTPYYKK